MIMALFQAVINGLGAMGRFIGMLPQSPFQVLTNYIPENPAIQAVLWIVPVSEALALMQIWLVAILAYYIVKVPLRWLKVVQG